MRFSSNQLDGFQIFAVSGTNTVSFAIKIDGANTNNLLGFGIERYDPTEDERYFLYGFKVFESVIAHPTPDIVVSTRDHPVQSLITDDFTAKPGRTYTYFFHPLRGKPKNIDRSSRPIPITIRTEAQFDAGETHNVFFNRGVASSQAYVRQFQNRSPDDFENAGENDKAEKARAWLSRDLLKAMVGFIDAAKAGDALHGCFYEFHFLDVLKAFARAKGRGVDVRLIVDAKDNSTPKVKAFPRDINLAELAKVGLPTDGTTVTLREARPSAIQHNKFIVLSKGAAREPEEVWTGSTNVSEGGIFGQTNVGHWVRDKNVARAYLKYWDILQKDPGATSDDTRSAAARQRNATFKAEVESISPASAMSPAAGGSISTVFSPRAGLAALDFYVDLLDQAATWGGITLAFGVTKPFKTRLLTHTANNALTMLLLEKEDKPTEKTKDSFTRLTAQNNVYMAFGAYLSEGIEQWARETYTKKLGLNTHVAYIHSKFLMKDPLGPDPIVVTGSANFSEPSTTDNDENMLVIRGSQRVADIYFTEFNRLFFHYYFRSVRELVSRRPTPQEGFSLFLDETNSWLSKYQPGSMRFKRAAILTGMSGTVTL